VYKATQINRVELKFQFSSVASNSVQSSRSEQNWNAISLSLHGLFKEKQNGSSVQSISVALYMTYMGICNGPSKNTALYTVGHNKKFELMLTRRAKAYSSSCSVV